MLKMRRVLIPPPDTDLANLQEFLGSWQVLITDEDKFRISFTQRRPTICFGLLSLNFAATLQTRRHSTVCFFNEASTVCINAGYTDNKNIGTLVLVAASQNVPPTDNRRNIVPTLAHRRVFTSPEDEAGNVIQVNKCLS
ncbi:hypothetical protein CEXT_83991 [Caerostris extrusa]|uniref:Uncharacterized protein n=1 Tax=Caerostris extrusa TaxID=172846 RepID=A0AAV4V9T8_CAEEX|nr:hypothetical protein CEXT_83991 [Caerostris extrusa]